LEAEMPSADLSEDEIAIRDLLEDLTEAWQRGDAKAYGARYQAGATFTNVFGDFHLGREQFDRRHADVFAGVFKGSTVAMEVRQLRFLRPDVAAVDLTTRLSGVAAPPPGVPVGADGALRSSLLMVLTKERGRWEIAVYHNVWQSSR
jgi:uncharacterized protein (TIGR02246 family)